MSIGLCSGHLDIKHFLLHLIVVLFLLSLSFFNYTPEFGLLFIVYFVQV